MNLNEKMYLYDGDNTHSCIYLFKPKLEANPVTAPTQTRYYLSNGTLVKQATVFATNTAFKFSRKVTLFANLEAP